MPTLADRVQETTSTTGTGTYALAGATSGFLSFVSGAGNGATVRYACVMGGDWEIGVGTVTSGTPDTLSRDSITGSSNAGAAVDWGSGTKSLFLPITAGDILQPASQADMEAATSNAKAVTPQNTHYHPGVAKAWAAFTLSGATFTVRDSYNISSVTDNANGDYTFNFSTSFSSAYYGIAACGGQWSAENNLIVPMIKYNVNPTASACRLVWAIGTPLGTVNGTPFGSAMFFGDQ